MIALLTYEDVPRKRHLPMRTCVACGQQGVKRDLLRLVRGQDGAPAVDPRGRLPGRGAYLCKSAAHGDAGRLRIRIKKALRLENDVTDEFLSELDEHVASVQSSTASE